MLASIVQISPLSIIRRKRMLPVPGRVLVRQGQKVEPHNILAEANLAPEHLLLNVARSLGVPSREARSVIQREVGEQVNEGDLIAGPVGITRKVLRAPVSGRIVLIRGDKVLFEVEKPLKQLQSGMAGTVVELIAERGAIIESIGALVQGVWGNGRIDNGLLQNKLDEPGGKLNSQDLDVSLRGTVVLGGYCDEAKAFRNAANIPLKGLILSSMSASLAPLAARMPFPIILLRGFGYRPLDSASYQLLSKNENREAVVNAVPFNRFNGTRPEVIIPLSTQDEPLHTTESSVFEAGQKVRLTTAVASNSIGIIEYITDKPVLLPSGLRSISAQIHLENEETIMMPLANLEILT